MRKFLASVGNAKLLGKKNGELYHIADVRTLTESTLSFANSMEEVRAGEGAQLYGRFSHSSGITVQITEAMWDLQYVALQVGASLNDTSPARNAFYHDNKYTGDTKTTSGSNTLSATPANIGNACGLNHPMVWVRLMGCSADTQWTAIEANGNTINLDNYPQFQGKNVCIEYFVNKPEAHAISVNSNFIPAELVLVLTTKLFAGDANAPETGKPVGYITIKIPRFQLDGQFDLSMAMTSAATINLSGTALAVDNGQCDGSGVYAEIVEIEENSNLMTGITDILLDNQLLDAGEIPGVYAKYSDSHISQIGAADYKISSPDDTTTASVAAKTTFVASKVNYVTVSADGYYWYVGEKAADPASAAATNKGLTYKKTGDGKYYAVVESAIAAGTYVYQEVQRGVDFIYEENDLSA